MHIEPTHWGARFARQARLALKELRETLRDRRTIVTLLMMPILVYPLLSMTFQRFLLAGIATEAPGPAIAMVERSEDFDRLGPLLNLGVEVLRARGEPDESSLVTVSGPREGAPDRDVSLSVQDGSADLGLRLVDGQGRLLRIQIYYREDKTSLAALERLERMLYAANTQVLREQMLRSGLGAESAVAVRRQKIEPEQGPSPLATLVPLVLILMTITGAVYPAIDLTAGERERGTLETLMAAPVSRLSLLLSKYVAVVCVALLTATVNLAAMALTIQLAGFAQLLFGPAGISIDTMLRVFGLLLLFATFFSALLLSVTSVARSFKEAQAYLIPLMLVAIAPGLLSMVPGMKLTAALAAVPLVNIVLVARDTFQQTADPGLSLVAVLTTVFYSLSAIAFAAYVFGNDTFLYGSKRNWGDLWQRSNRMTPEPALGTALFCVALLYPGQFVLGGLIAQAGYLPLSGKLLAAGATTIALFLGIPLTAAFWGRVRVTSGFRLQLAAWPAWLAAVILGATMWPLAHAAFQWAVQSGLASLGKSDIQRVDLLARQLQTVPIGLVVVCTGIIPAVFEELFFRGYLFASLRRHLSGRATVMATALLFAAFHLVTPGMLAIERFFPSLVLGAILGGMALLSGSVWPGIIAHALHNGLLLSLVAFYRPAPDVGTTAILEARLPLGWYVASGCGLAVGGALYVWLWRQRRPATSAPSGPSVTG